VDEGQRRRFRVGGEKQVEPLARGVAVPEIENAAILLAHQIAARRPVGDDLPTLRHGEGVVVGDVKLGAIHSTVEHVTL
jgi:hypothetical protein